MSRYEGSCHCGALKVRFESARQAGELPVRECACSFCRTHGARTMTDPSGTAWIQARGASLNRYRFGLMTADFIVCRNCGAYLGAYFEDAGQGYATLNVNAFDERAAFTQPAQSADYNAEDSSGRMARRRLRWTPAQLIEEEERP